MDLSMHSSCSSSLDDRLGPRVHTCRREFDFTIAFEEVLSISLSALFLLSGPLRLTWLYARLNINRHTRILSIKLFLTATNIGVHIALVAFWASTDSVTTSYTTPTAVLLLLGSLLILPLSVTEHYKAIKPSALLSSYLALCLLLDVVRTRTLWLSTPDQTTTQIYSASVAVRLVLLISESCSKSRISNEKHLQPSPEESSGIFGRSLFAWLNPLLFKGFTHKLSMDHLFPLSSEMSASHLSARFGASWESISASGGHRLITTVIKTLKWPLIAPVSPRVALVAFTVCQPLLVRRVILYLDETRNNDTANIGYGLIGAYMFVYTGIAISTAWYYYSVWRFVVMNRACLVSAIYRKTLTMKAATVNKSDALTLMSSDVERVGSALRTIHEMWANLAQIGIAIFLVQQQLGVACAAPVALALCASIAAIKLSTAAGKRQVRWMEAIEKRITFTSYYLQRNKNIKLLGLSNYISQHVQALRLKEMKAASHFRIITVCVTALGYAPLLFCPVVAFAAFRVIPRKDENSLDAARLFTSYSLILLIVSPLATLLQSFPRLASAYDCMRRIQAYLVAEEQHDQRHLMLQPMSEKASSIDDQDIISVQDVDIGLEDIEVPILSGLTFKIPPFGLTMIIGPVASGKSTLLKAVLGECVLSRGSISLPNNSIGFCEQMPWLTNATIRENIVGTSDFSPDWYAEVLYACVLQMFSSNDHTVVGSDGVILSGGQRQRIAIARAVYDTNQLIILDDVLSGLDARTQSTIFARLLGPTGLLRKHKRTIILATHAVQFLPCADHIIELSIDGTILRQGQYDNFRTKELDLHHLPSNAGLEEELTNEKPPELSTMPQSEEEGEDEHSTGDESYKDSLQWKYYFQSVGWRILIIFFSMEFLYGLLSALSQVWLKQWSQSNNLAGSKYSKYPGIYALIQSLAMIALIEGTRYGLIKIVTSGGVQFHNVILKSTLSAPLAWMTSIDAGSLLNRFSQDMQLIDIELPVALVNVATCGFLLCGHLFIVVISSYYVIAALPVMLCILYAIQKVYLRTSRQLRMLELESKAPLFTHYTESLKGLVTIRALRWTAPSEKQNARLLDASQKPYYLLVCIQQWLVLTLDLLSAGFAVLLVGLVVVLRDKSSPGFTGAALVSLMTISPLLNEVVNYWTQLEISMASVSRVRKFEQETPSEDLPGESDVPPSQWPQSGKVEFRNVSASYGSKLVLDRISVSISAGEKIGICGPSGSGKSSLILTLMGILNLTSGCIIVDGVDLARTPRQTVRSRFNTIPQEPFLLRGTFRESMDPLAKRNDLEIKDALTRVGLWDAVNSKGGLDVELKEDMLSQGQRQLACLARALLRQSRVVVLDEVTSSTDVDTEKTIQNIVRDEFRQCTVIAVAHRLSTVMDFDRILVLSEGKIIEIDTPSALLNRPSMLRTMVEAAKATG